jgi:hypothetical protein
MIRGLPIDVTRDSNPRTWKIGFDEPPWKRRRRTSARPGADGPERSARDERRSRAQSLSLRQINRLCLLQIRAQTRRMEICIQLKISGASTPQLSLQRETDAFAETVGAQSRGHRQRDNPFAISNLALSAEEMEMRLPGPIAEVRERSLPGSPSSSPASPPRRARTRAALVRNLCGSTLCVLSCLRKRVTMQNSRMTHGRECRGVWPSASAQPSIRLFEQFSRRKHGG